MRRKLNRTIEELCFSFNSSIIFIFLYHEKSYYQAIESSDVPLSSMIAAFALTLIFYHLANRDTVEREFVRGCNAFFFVAYIAFVYKYDYLNGSVEMKKLVIFICFFLWIFFT